MSETLTYLAERQALVDLFGQSCKEKGGQFAFTERWRGRLGAHRAPLGL